MTVVAVKRFNGVDLGALGLVTPQVSGLFDLPSAELSRVFIPLRDLPHDVHVRGEIVRMKLRCIVAGSDHDDLARRMAVLRIHMSPRLGWCPLEVESRPFERTWARSGGFSANIDRLPYITNVIEFDWTVERVPYWEDRAVISMADPASITYGGSLVGYPEWICTANAALNNGLTLQVGEQIFTYSGSLARGDRLAIATSLFDATVNGARDFGNVHMDSVWPTLDPGTTYPITKTGNYSLRVEYRRRRE